MRFLVVSESRESMPMEMVLPAMHGMQAWLAEHRASGKLEHVWSFAGTDGGGGIVNVDSHEELDEIMSGFPFAQTSTVHVYPLADIDSSMKGAIASFEAMLASAGA